MVERFSPVIETLEAVYNALVQAQDCIRGETPEDISDEEAREDTISKVRDAMRAIESMQSRSSAGIEDRPIRQIDLGSISRYEEHTGESFEPDDEALIFLNDDNEQTCHVEGPNAKAMAAQIVAAVRSSTPAQPSRVTGCVNQVEEAACLIWAELCPGMVMGDADLPHYEAAAKAVLALSSTDRQNMVASDPSPEKIDPQPEPLL